MSSIIEFTPGSTKKIDIRLKQKDGSPLNLQGAQIRMIVRDRMIEPNHIFLDLTRSAGEIQVVGENYDTLRVRLTEEQTASIKVTALYDVRIELEDGTSFYYPYSGPSFFKRKGRVTL